MPAIVALAAQIIPLLITAGMDIAPTLERLFSIQGAAPSQADWDFLKTQRAAALATINDTHRDVPA